MQIVSDSTNRILRSMQHEIDQYGGYVKSAPQATIAAITGYDIRGLTLKIELAMRGGKVWEEGERRHLLHKSDATRVEVAARRHRGKLHSLNDKPALKLHLNSGTYATTLWHRFDEAHVWMQHNKIHRDSQPAVVAFDGGKEVLRIFVNNGLTHRIGDRYAIESQRLKMCVRSGVLSRREDDAPSVANLGLLCSDETSRDIRLWVNHGVGHRTGKPAYIVTERKDGSPHVLETSYFLQGGQLHNDGDLAIISTIDDVPIQDDLNDERCYIYGQPVPYHRVLAKKVTEL